MKTIPLGDLLGIAERHNVRVELSTRASDHRPGGRLTDWSPEVAVCLVSYGDDGDALRPVLQSLEALGATWPWGRTIPAVDDSAAIADLYGEMPVVEGRPPWRLRVQIHGAPRRVDLPPAPRVEV